MPWIFRYLIYEQTIDLTKENKKVTKSSAKRCCGKVLYHVNPGGQILSPQPNKLNTRAHSKRILLVGSKGFNLSPDFSPPLRLLGFRFALLGYWG